MKPLAADEYEALCCMLKHGRLLQSLAHTVPCLVERGLGTLEPDPRWELGFFIIEPIALVAMACYRALHTEHGLG